MILTRVYDFLQVLSIKRMHSTKNDYFSKHKYFSTIYKLQKLKLKHNNYFEQNINMIYFVQANEHDMSMLAKIQY
jgi:hypothetical protein